MGIVDRDWSLRRDYNTISEQEKAKQKVQEANEDIRYILEDRYEDIVSSNPKTHSAQIEKLLNDEASRWNKLFKRCEKKKK